MELQAFREHGGPGDEAHVPAVPQQEQGDQQDQAAGVLYVHIPEARAFSPVELLVLGFYAAIGGALRTGKAKVQPSSRHQTVAPPPLRLMPDPPPWLNPPVPLSAPRWVSSMSRRCSSARWRRFNARWARCTMTDIFDALEFCLQEIERGADVLLDALLAG